MESFRLATSVVLPLVVYMMLGSSLRKTGVISLHACREMNSAIFKIFIPLSLFFNIYEAKIDEVFRADVFCFVIIAILVLFCVTYFAGRRMITDKSDAATVIQGIYRSNFVLFGVAVAAPLCSGTGLATVGALSAFVVPLINMLAVILFETMNGGNVNKMQIFKNILKNPLVIAGILGMICSLLQVKFPVLLEGPLKTLGNMATPLALVILGGMLSFESIRKHKMYLIVVTVCRLVIVPIVMLTAGYAIGLRGEMLIVVLSVAAAPTAVASAPMAQTMGGNAELASEIVAVTTVFSVFSIFGFVFVLAGLGMI
ncbi:MAG: AEC family transporter [Eubacteriales bacterium]|nr:AEC family transporter [Eubacteriales bacterium]